MKIKTINTTLPRPGLTFYAIAIVIGFLTGALGASFHQLVEYSTLWSQHLPKVLGLKGLPLYIAMAVFSAALICFGVALVRVFAPEAGGSGVQEIEGAMVGKRLIRWKRIIPIKFIGGFTVLTGGLIGGREGPTIHMGASIAKGISDRFSFTLAEKRSLWGAGGAAGLASAFNAPLASIIFVLEEARNDFPYTMRNYAAVVLACGCSAIATGLISGVRPFMAMSATAMPLEFLPVFVVLGVLFGVLGVAFNFGLMRALEWAQKIGLRFSPYLVPALLGCVLGPLLVSLPEAAGGGERFVVAVVKNPLPIALLGLVALLRFFGTMASYSTGAPSGIFAPILSLATTVAVLFAGVLEWFVDMPTDATVAIAVAGMAALFASTVRAPLVGMVLVAELTGTYALALPVLIASITSSLVAELLGGRPIYEVLLERTINLNIAGLNDKPK
ncbi:MAG TPA: H(+)/Cl(-) exchange transporter ClcA [Burkholderiaceae bacterium]|nr:H(+)/Cl(-) exchange transporter ClcA [Burkholderiaceae bacterium]